MVLGCAELITCAPEVTQCADTTQTAFGRGKRTESSSSVLVYALCSMAFIGDPCPTNRTGIFTSASIQKNPCHPERRVFHRGGGISVSTDVERQPKHLATQRQTDTSRPIRSRPSPGCN